MYIYIYICFFFITETHESQHMHTLRPTPTYSSYIHLLEYVCEACRGRGCPPADRVSISKQKPMAELALSHRSPIPGATVEQGT